MDCRYDPFQGPQSQETCNAHKIICTSTTPQPTWSMHGAQVPRVKADASARVARALADAYEAVYQVLMDPQHGYEAAATQTSDAVKHTPLQVRTILGVVT